MQSKLYILEHRNILKNHFNFTVDVDYSLHESKQSAVDAAKSINKHIHIVEEDVIDYTVDRAKANLRQSNTPIYSSYDYAVISCIEVNKVCRYRALVKIANVHSRDYIKMVMRTNEMNLYKCISDNHSELYFLNESEVFESLTKYKHDTEWTFYKEVLPNVRNIYTDKTFFSIINLYNDLKGKLVISGQYYCKDGLTYEVILPELEDMSGVNFQDFDGNDVVMLKPITATEKYIYDTVITCPIKEVINNLKLTDVV